jgi:thymidylate kinase
MSLLPTPGRLIAIYGINNLGKTTQAVALQNRIGKQAKRPCRYLKYPIYTLEPTGPMINSYLRHGNPFDLSPREAQLLYVLNRTHYDPNLRKHLQSGEYVVAEDYVGTGIAWGGSAGVDQEFLIQLNCHLYHEDVAILLKGDRFMTGRESGHRHESDGNLIQTARAVHEELAARFGWHVVDANQSVQQVHEDIWRFVAPLF